MNFFAIVRRRVGRWITVGTIAVVGFGSMNYVDNLFEISKNLDIYYTLFRELNVFYVDEPDPGKLVKTSIDAMLQELDPYTNYIPESDIEDYRFMMSGEYGGIGAAISKKEEDIIITEPYEGFPADKAGLIAGDVITKVDGRAVQGMSTDEVSTLLKGQAGTAVDVEVTRDGEVFNSTLERQEIKIPDVPYFGFVDDKIGYAKLNAFTQTASSEVLKAFNELKGQGMEKFILDLRGNGGGLLNEAVNIVNIFVEKGELVVEMKGRIESANRKYKTLNTATDKDMQIVVLVDGGSASASEIVSGSLQDLDRGVIVGQTSFGKGLVQQTRDLTYNSKLKVTIAKYYTPSGRCIQKLDYGARTEEGSVEEVPDSLLSVFKTRNNRDVMDGRGIEPDIKIPEKYYSDISIALIRERLIFDWVTQYRRTHEKLDEPGTFKLTDQEYNDFKSWLSTQSYAYTTDTEEMLEKLKKEAIEEQYFDRVNGEYEALKAKLVPDKAADLEIFKDEIKQLIESEIVTRYYYANGRIKHVLSGDPFIVEAIEILNDPAAYNKLLGN